MERSVTRALLNHPHPLPVTAAPDYSLIGRFACVCTVDDQEFPQGSGRTKKEAKTEAARNAFMALLGLEDQDQDDGMTSVTVCFLVCLSAFLSVCWSTNTLSQTEYLW